MSDHAIYLEMCAYLLALVFGLLTFELVRVLGLLFCC